MNSTMSLLEGFYLNKNTRGQISKMAFVCGGVGGGGKAPSWGPLRSSLRPQESFPCGSDGKASACKAGDLGSIPALGRSLENRMATHSNILA